MNEMKTIKNSDGSINYINLHIGMKLQISIKFERNNILNKEDIENIKDSIRKIMESKRKKEINDE